MKRTRRQKGFMLLLIVAMMPLLGMAGVVLTSNSRQMLAVTTRTALNIHAQLAWESGVEWIAARRRNSIMDDQPIVLQIDHKNKKITCTIKQISRTDQQTVFLITGYAEYSRFSAKHQQQFILKY